MNEIRNALLTMAAVLTTSLLHAQGLVPNATPTNPAPTIIPVASQRGTIRLEQDQDVDIQLGYSLLARSAGRIESVQRFDPNVVTVEAVGQDLIRVLSRGAGSTSIVVRSEGGKETKLNVRVYSKSLNTLTSLLKRLYPGTELTLHEVGTSLLVRGTVKSKTEAEEIVEIGQQFYPEVLNQLRPTANHAALKPAEPTKASNADTKAEDTDLRTEIRELRKDVRRLLQLLEQRGRRTTSVIENKPQPAPSVQPAVVQTSGSEVKPPRPGEPTNHPRLIGTNADGETTIDGRSFQEWQQIVEFEPSPLALIPAVRALVSLGRRKYPEETAESLFALFSRFPAAIETLEGEGNELLQKGAPTLLLEVLLGFNSIHNPKALNFIVERIRGKSPREVSMAFQFYAVSIELQANDSDSYAITPDMCSAMIDAWNNHPTFRRRSDIVHALLNSSATAPENLASLAKDERQKFHDWLISYQKSVSPDGWPSAWIRERVMTLMLKLQPENAQPALDIVNEIRTDRSSKSLSVNLYRLAINHQKQLAPFAVELIQELKQASISGKPIQREVYHGGQEPLSHTFSHRICLVELLGQMGAGAKDAVPVIEAALAKIPADEWGTAEALEQTIGQQPQLLVIPRQTHRSNYPPSTVNSTEKESSRFVKSALIALYQITGEKPDVSRLKPVETSGELTPFKVHGGIR